MDDSLDDSSSDGWLAPEALVGVVETALAQAPRLAAAAAERWDIVRQLAEELTARRNGAAAAGTTEHGGAGAVTRTRRRLIAFGRRGK